MKYTTFLFAALLIFVACDSGDPVVDEPETPVVDSTTVENVEEPDVNEGNYTPENLDRMTTVIDEFKVEFKNLSAAALTDSLGIDIIGDEKTMYSGYYSMGRSKTSLLAHGDFAFTTEAPKSKKGTWTLYGYQGSMSYGKPAGEWSCRIMDFVDGKPHVSAAFAIPFVDGVCGKSRVVGQIHKVLTSSDLEVESPAAGCSLENIYDAALDMVSDKIKMREEKLKAKAEATS